MDNKVSVTISEEANANIQQAITLLLQNLPELINLKEKGMRCQRWVTKQWHLEQMR